MQRRGPGSSWCRSPLLRGSGLTNLVVDSDARAVVTNAALVPEPRPCSRRSRWRPRRPFTPAWTATPPGTARTASSRGPRARSRRRSRSTATTPSTSSTPRDDRPSQGDRAHACDSGGLLHGLRRKLPRPPGERRPPLRVARLQRGVLDADARLLPRLHVRPPARGFQAEGMIDAVERERRTPLVPSQLVALLQRPDFGEVRCGSLEMDCALSAHRCTRAQAGAERGPGASASTG